MATQENRSMEAAGKGGTLSYDPVTGEFSRVGAHCSNGGNIGHIDKYGYRRVRFGGKQYKAHRLAHYFMTNEWPELPCDHINGDRADNRWTNLRWVSARENSLNAKRMRNNTSGVTGLSWYTKNQCWMVRIHDQYIGSYTDYFEACCARKSAEVSHGYHANHDRSAA